MNKYTNKLEYKGNIKYNLQDFRAFVTSQKKRIIKCNKKLQKTYKIKFKRTELHFKCNYKIILIRKLPCLVITY